MFYQPWEIHLVLTVSDPRVPAVPGGWQRIPGASACWHLYVLLQQYGNLQERGHNLTSKTRIAFLTQRDIRLVVVTQEYEQLVESSQQYQNLDNPIYRVCIEKASNAGATTGDQSLANCATSQGTWRSAVSMTPRHSQSPSLSHQMNSHRPFTRKRRIMSANCR